MSPGLLLLAAFVVGLVVAALVPPGREPGMGRAPGAARPREVTDDRPALPGTSSDLAVTRDERGSVEPFQEEVIVGLEPTRSAGGGGRPAGAETPG